MNRTRPAYVINIIELTGLSMATLRSYETILMKFFNDRPTSAVTIRFGIKLGAYRVASHSL